MTNTLKILCNLCSEAGILLEAIDPDNWDVNLVDAGLLDSMSLVYLQEIISAHFKVEIEPVIFLTEAPSLRIIAQHIDSRINNLTALLPC
jgi:hypothetical protein